MAVLKMLDTDTWLGLTAEGEKVKTNIYFAKKKKKNFSFQTRLISCKLVLRLSDVHDRSSDTKVELWYLKKKKA